MANFLTVEDSLQLAAGFFNKLNKSDARSSRKCPWTVDLENMAMPSALLLSLAEPAEPQSF
jgi:hypothetical protein